MTIDIFAIVNDGSSDTGLEKMNALCTHNFDIERSNKVEVKFFNMCITSGEHFLRLKVFLMLFNAWEQCVSIGLGSTNVNAAVKSSIKSMAQQRNKSYFTAGFNCHLAHTAASNGGSS